MAAPPGSEYAVCLSAEQLHCQGLRPSSVEAEWREISADLTRVPSTRAGLIFERSIRVQTSPSAPLLPDDDDDNDDAGDRHLHRSTPLFAIISQLISGEERETMMRRRLQVGLPPEDVFLEIHPPPGRRELIEGAKPPRVNLALQSPSSSSSKSALRVTLLRSPFFFASMEGSAGPPALPNEARTQKAVIDRRTAATAKRGNTLRNESSLTLPLMMISRWRRRSCNASGESDFYACCVCDPGRYSPVSCPNARKQKSV